MGGAPVGPFKPQVHAVASATPLHSSEEPESPESAGSLLVTGRIHRGHPYPVAGLPSKTSWNWAPCHWWEGAPRPAIGKADQSSHPGRHALCPDGRGEASELGLWQHPEWPAFDWNRGVATGGGGCATSRTGRDGVGRTAVAAIVLSSMTFAAIVGSASTARADGEISAFASPEVFSPGGITAGPDGARWFDQHLDDSIGRMTTAGVVTNLYTDPSITRPTGITSGPDGAVWFTNFASVDRITTSGAISSFTDPSIHCAGAITTGPDDALWFTNCNSIGRITTSGAVSSFADPGIVDTGFDHVRSGRLAVVHRRGRRHQRQLHRTDHHLGRGDHLHRSRHPESRFDRERPRRRPGGSPTAVPSGGSPPQGRSRPIPTPMGRWTSRRVRTGPCGSRQRMDACSTGALDRCTTADRSHHHLGGDHRFRDPEPVQPQHLLPGIHHRRV